MIGFSIAAPIGPIGLLCIRCAVAHGRLNGFLCGLGAATADACYGTVAALGLTAVTSFLLGAQPWLQLLGGGFLVGLGIQTVRTAPPPAEGPRSADGAALASGYFSTLGLTLMNPMTILPFLGIFAGLGIGAQSGGALPASALVLGVFFGSAAWWLVLSMLAGWLGDRLRHRGLRTLNVASGLIIAGFGVWQLGALLRSLR